MNAFLTGKNAFAAAGDAWYYSPTSATTTSIQYSQQYRRLIYTQKCKSDASMTVYTQQCRKISNYSLNCIRQTGSSGTTTCSCPTSYVCWLCSCQDWMTPYGTGVSVSGYEGCIITTDAGTCGSACSGSGSFTCMKSVSCSRQVTTYNAPSSVCSGLGSGCYSTGSSYTLTYSYQTITGATSSLSCSSLGGGWTDNGSVTAVYVNQSPAPTSTTDSTPDCDTANGFSAVGSPTSSVTYDYQYPTGTSTPVACPVGYTADGAPTSSYEYQTVTSIGTPPTSPGPEWTAFGSLTSSSTTTTMSLGSGVSGSGSSSGFPGVTSGTLPAGNISIDKVFGARNRRIELFESCYAMRQLEYLGFISGTPQYEKGGSTLCNYTDHNPNGDFGNLTKKIRFSADVGVFIADATRYSSTANTPGYVTSNANTPMTQGVSKDVSALFALYPEMMSNVPNLGSTDTLPKYFYNAIAIYNVRNLSVAAVNSNIAQIIDNKIDDGKPYSGQLVAGMFTASDIDTTYSPALAPSKTKKIANQKYCSDIDIACVNAGNCTATAFQNAKYQLESPSSLERGCNLFMLLNDK